MKVMIMAGGTGGHVYPALAVAHRLREQKHDIVWMGTPDSFEARVVPQHDFPIEFVRISGLRGKGLLKLLLAPFLLLRAIADAWTILERQRPDVVLGMGGFASGPGGIASWLLKRPLAIHEQNAVAGLTNRWLARLARRVLQAFPNTFANGKTVGNPVREAVAAVPPPESRLWGRKGPLNVLVVGGSQGARALNEIVPEALCLIPVEERPNVRHQAGRTLAAAKARYEKLGLDVPLTAFIEDMASAYAWADLVVCRAGASTVAELAAAGCAAVLVPFPAAVDDHQTRNAEYLVRAGAAILIQERHLTPQKLADTLRMLNADRTRVLAMAAAARRAAWPSATDAIVEQVKEAALP
ncbi:MAG: undecaprenyldiphospho-muramoylpentapeptide beta-N-acetylglucosaminyltransferase [Gammaproteobacteria bacterium]|nr:undecaprenyldiphospho-muramoylpentapeptide beta-N-acetylglucosaminyltransferase [Gammaproteobacteria bacterium]